MSNIESCRGCQRRQGSCNWLRESMGDKWMSNLDQCWHPIGTILVIWEQDE